jgi:cbb3-type cytochrome oxidase subunit 3
MIKELKYSIFLISIFLFFFLIIKHYFSENYKKTIYRSLTLFDEKTEKYVKNLPYLKSDTNNIVEYIDDESDPLKKKFFFWKLLDNDEK